MWHLIVLALSVSWNSWAMLSKGDLDKGALLARAKEYYEVNDTAAWEDYESTPTKIYTGATMLAYLQKHKDNVAFAVSSDGRKILHGFENKIIEINDNDKTDRPNIIDLGIPSNHSIDACSFESFFRFLNNAMVRKYIAVDSAGTIYQQIRECVRYFVKSDEKTKSGQDKWLVEMQPLPELEEKWTIKSQDSIIPFTAVAIQTPQLSRFFYPATIFYKHRESNTQYIGLMFSANGIIKFYTFPEYPNARDIEILDCTHHDSLNTCTQYRIKRADGWCCAYYYSWNYEDVIYEWPDNISYDARIFRK